MAQLEAPSRVESVGNGSTQPARTHWPRDLGTTCILPSDSDQPASAQAGDDDDRILPSDDGDSD